jgi:hypothetical protein
MSTLESLPAAVKSVVNVLIKNEVNGKVSATILGLPEYRVESSDRQTALSDLQNLVTARLVGAEIVSLEIELPQPENPWLRFAGIFKDDPYFDQMLESIAEYRREKDAELEEYYCQLEKSGEKPL